MAANTTQIRAGQAYVELVAKDEKLTAGLKKAESRLKSWGASIAGLGAKVFAAGMLIDGAFDAAVFKFAETGSEMTRLSQKTGISVENLSTLGFAADQSGVSLEDFAVGMKHLQKTLGEAAGGSKEAQGHLARLGLTVRDLAALSPDKQFEAVADAIAGIPNPTQRAAAALQIFGRHGTAMLPLLSQGAAGIREMQQTARDWGLEMSTRDAAAALDLTKTLKLLAATFKMIVFQIGAAAAPAFQMIRDRIAPIARDVLTWIRGNTGLVVSITKIGIVVAGVGVAIIALGSAISAVGTIIGGVTAVITALISPWVLIPALVVGAVGAILYFGGAFDGMAKTAVSAWGGIVDAIKAGDLTLAGQIAIAGLKVVWIGFKQWFTELWDRMVLDVATLMNIILFKWDHMVGVMKRETPEQLHQRDQFHARVQLGLNRSFARKNRGRAEEMNAAKDELDELTRKAAAEAAAGKAAPSGPGAPQPLSPMQFLAQAESQGTFSGAAASQMGFGESLPQKMLSALNMIAENTDGLVPAVEASGALG